MAKFGAEVGLIWADDSDLIAIYNYVEELRPKIAQFPKLQAKIEDFERWYQQLSWYDIHVMINDTLAEAYRRRDELNTIMGESLRATDVPGDILNRRPGSASGLPAPPPPPWWKITVPTWLKVTAVGVPAGIATLISIGAIRKALWL